MFVLEHCENVEKRKKIGRKERMEDWNRDYSRGNSTRYFATLSDTLGPLPGYLAVLSTSSDLAIPDLSDITIRPIRFFALHPWVGAILSLTFAIVRSKEPTQPAWRDTRGTSGSFGHFENIFPRCLLKFCKRDFPKIPQSIRYFPQNPK